MNIQERSQETYKLILEIIYNKDPDLKSPLELLELFGKECFSHGRISGITHAMDSMAPKISDLENHIKETIEKIKSLEKK